MAEIQDLIEHAEITEESEDLGKVGLGSIVTVKDLEFDSIEKYKIVGSQEANPLDGKISDDSPIGKALYGHESGETVIVEAPGGNYSYEIISIEK